MKKIFAVFAAVALLFSACSENQASISSDELSSAASSRSEGESVSGAASETSSEPSFEVSSEPSDWDETCVGAANDCLEHHALYHAVNGRVIDYVGYEALEEWRETLPAERDAFNRNYGDAFSIQAFIEHFDIPKDIFTELERGGLTADFLAEFDGVAVCSLAQIDALYSGNQTRINEAFCGELSLVHEGELYSPYWLAEHNAREVIESSVSINALEVLVDRLETAYAPFSTVMEKLALDARVTLESAVALDNYYPCYAHDDLFHSIDNELMRHIGGYAAFAEWLDGKGLLDGYVYGNEPMAEVDKLSSLVVDFGIDRETFVSLTDGYTPEQVDAIYSGDPARVNEAFCGELAFVYEGELRSIYELAEMDDLSGLPRDEIEALLSRTGGYPGNVQAMAAKIRFNLQRLEYLS